MLLYPSTGAKGMREAIEKGIFGPILAGTPSDLHPIQRGGPVSALREMATPASQSKGIDEVAKALRADQASRKDLACTTPADFSFSVADARWEPHHLLQVRQG